MNVYDLDLIRQAARAAAMTGRFIQGQVILSLEVPSADCVLSTGTAAARLLAAIKAAEALGFRREYAEYGWVASLRAAHALLLVRFAPDRSPTR